MKQPLERVRLDRWLWAARFFKSRAMAKSAVEGGKVELDGQRGKPSKEIALGQQLSVRRGDEIFEIEVIALADKRGSATIAATLFRESEDSINRRAADVARRKMERAGLQVPDKRPEKRDRRALAKMKQADDT
jgi:ribosome-associated heat shock protein Hsp15